jgi:hypothetical protein
MEKLNTKDQELTIEQLDIVSGGAMFIQPPILAVLATAVAIRAGIEAVVHRIFH